MVVSPSCGCKWRVTVLQQAIWRTKKAVSHKWGTFFFHRRLHDLFFMQINHFLTTTSSALSNKRCLPDYNSFCTSNLKPTAATSTLASCFFFPRKALLLRIFTQQHVWFNRSDLTEKLYLLNTITDLQRHCIYHTWTGQPIDYIVGRAHNPWTIFWVLHVRQSLKPIWRTDVGSLDCCYPFSLPLCEI